MQPKSFGPKCMAHCHCKIWDAVLRRKRGFSDFKPCRPSSHGVPIVLSNGHISGHIQLHARQCPRSISPKYLAFLTHVYTPHSVFLIHPLINVPHLHFNRLIKWLTSTTSNNQSNHKLLQGNSRNKNAQRCN